MPCRRQRKKKKNIPKNQVFAEIYHDVVASEKTVWVRKFDTGVIIEHKKDQNISMKVMGIDGATIGLPNRAVASKERQSGVFSPEFLGTEKITEIDNLILSAPLNWKT